MNRPEEQQRAMRDLVLTIVTDHYLSSHDFNGLPGAALLAVVGEDECRPIVEELIGEELLSLNFGNYHPNPHIKAFPARPADEQVAMLRDRGLEAACLYPERRHLETVVQQERYQGQPYALALALGGPELSY
jgi:hypothetical protein